MKFEELRKTPQICVEEEGIKTVRFNANSKSWISESEDYVNIGENLKDLGQVSYAF